MVRQKLLLCVVVLLTSASILGQTQSQEVVRILRETLPPEESTQFQPFADKLMSAGVTKPADLAAYLVSTDQKDEGRTQANALLAMKLFGNVDKETLKLVDQIALRDTTFTLNSRLSELYSLELDLGSRSRDEVMQLLPRIVKKSQKEGLEYCMRWIYSQDPSWLESEKHIPELVTLCYQRMTTLFKAGQIDGPSGALFALACKDKAPFNESKYISEKATAFSAALSKPAALQDFSLQSCFAILVDLSKVEPKLVETALSDTILSNSDPVRKVILWKLFESGLAKTPIGQGIIDTVVAKHENLKGYIERLRTAKLIWMGAEGEVGEEVKRAFQESRAQVEKK